MNDKKDFDEAIKMGTVPLLISGITISELKLNKYVNVFINNNWMFYLNFFWVQTDVLAEICWVIEGIKLGRSIVEVSLIGPCITLCLINIAKVIPLFYKKEVLKSVVNKFRELHPVTTVDRDVLSSEDTIVKKSTKLIYLTGLALSSSILTLGLCFNMVPAVLMLINVSTTGETDLKLPYLTKYFFEPNTKLHALLYVHQSVSTFAVCFNVIGTDAIFYALCTFMTMHFDILSLRFKHAMSFKSQKEIRANLVQLIHRHHELIRLSNQIETVFSKSILFHIMSSSILICLCLFNIAFTRDIGNIIIFSLFLMMSLTHTFLVCYFGDMLMTSSTKFSESVYNCGWYNAELDIQKCVLFVLMRAQKPCKITAAGFADLTMNIFTWILYKTWSYFALLRTICE